MNFIATLLAWSDPLADLREHWFPVALSLLGYLIPIGLVPHVLLSRRDRGSTLAWILLIVFVPYVGAILYWMLGHRQIERLERKLEGARAAIQHPLIDRTVLALRDPDLESLTRVACRSGAPPPTSGNAVRIFDDNRTAFDAMLAAIDDARHSVEMESYIFRADRLGRQFIAALARAARRGVRARLLVDGVGAFKMSSRDVEAFVAAGGEFMKFLPVGRPRLRPRINFRLHRKLLLVDDRTFFVGSLNVGDELVGSAPPWREVHSRIDGPAALQAREVFEADWFFAGGVPRDDVREPVRAAGDDVVQLFASGPTERVSATSRVYFSAIAMAREEVLIATPYFVPTRPLLAALESAALRGARVRIAVPGANDIGIVTAAARYFVPTLHEAGVEVLVLPRQMLHAKVACFDRKAAIVGSANFDQRSLDLSFELNALLLGEKAVSRVRRSIVEMHAAAEPFLVGKRRMSQRLFDAAARVLAPVL